MDEKDGGYSIIRDIKLHKKKYGISREILAVNNTIYALFSRKNVYKNSSVVTACVCNTYIRIIDISKDKRGISAVYVSS